MSDTEITFELRNPEMYILVALLGFLFYLLVRMTLATPITFGDEGFHTRMAQHIAEEREYPLWVPFTETESSKSSFFRPPLWNILEASFLFVFGFSEAIVKVLTPLIAVLTGLAVYLFAKQFYNGRVGFVAAVMLVTLPSFVTYSVLFYTDILITFYITMFLCTFALAIKTGRRMYMLAAGVFGAYVFMTKLTGYIIYGLIGVVFLYLLYKEKKFLSLIKKYSPLFLMLILIPSTFFIRNYVYYNTPICSRLPIVGGIIDSIFDRSGCTISDFEPEYEFAGRTEQAGSESDVLNMGIMNYLSFAYGNIWLVVFAFFGGMFITMRSVFESKDSRIVDVILVIMLLLYIPVFLTSTKRAEDTSRYSLIWAPVITLMAARYFDALYDFAKNYHKILALIVFMLVSAIVLFMGFSGVSAKLDGMSQVKQFSTLFFEACDWAGENTPKDSVMATVWVYRTAYSCQRGAAGINADMVVSNDVPHILSTAEELGITHIFIQKFSIDFQNRHYSEMYDWDFVKLLRDNPDNFVNVYENGPDLDTCLNTGGCDGNIIYEIRY